MSQVSSKSLGVIVRIAGETVIKNFLKVGDSLPHVSSMDFSVDFMLRQKNISIELYEGKSCKEIDYTLPVWNDRKKSFENAEGKYIYQGYLEFPIDYPLKWHLDGIFCTQWTITFYVNEYGLLYTTCTPKSFKSKSTKIIDKFEETFNKHFEQIPKDERVEGGIWNKFWRELFVYCQIGSEWKSRGYSELCRRNIYFSISSIF